MKSFTRTIIVLVIVNLVIGNFVLAQNASSEVNAEPVAPVAPSRVRMPVTPKPIQPLSAPPVQIPVEPTPPTELGPRAVTISGRAFINNIVMTGLPGNPVTDQLGYYTAKVPLNWTGVVKPKKNGFIFKPTERFYKRITSNITKENYLPTGAVPVPVFNQAGIREVLVIPAADVEAEDLAAITEDLQVMSHIFDERFKEGQEIQGIFVDFGDIFGRDSRSTEAIYIQNYGVLFLMEVNFAFSPSSKPQKQETKNTEEYIDPDWQRAKQKLFSPKGFGGASVPEEQYSAQQIEQIKTELIRTLKHAANIRTLQPDEWIILTVIGQGRQPGGMFEDYYRSAVPRTGASRSRGRSSSRGRSPYGREDTMGGMMGGGIGGGVMMGGGSEDYSGTGSASTTVLTIRAKKSDVDDFAKGEIDFEQFQQKVDIFTY